MNRGEMLTVTIFYLVFPLGPLSRRQSCSYNKSSVLLTLLLPYVCARICLHKSISAVAGVSTVGFGEIDRAVQEDDETTIQVDLFGSNVDDITLRVFPVTVEEFYRLYSSSWTVTQAVQDRLDAIRDPAECM